MKKLFFTIFLTSSILFSSTTIVTVNGHKITDDIIPAYEKLDAQKKEIVKNQLIDEYLLATYAIKSGVTKDKNFQKAYKAQLQTIQKIYKEKTKKDLTKEQKENIKGSLAIKFLLAKEAKKIKVTDKEAKEFYEKNKEKFKFPESVEIASIATNDKKEAEKILNEIKKAKNKPAKLMQIAKKMNQRGYIGWVPKNAFPPEVFKKLYSMKVNSLVKKPIEVNGVYNITYLVNKRKAGTAKFSEIKDNLKKLIQREKLGLWSEKKVKELRSKATIK